MSYKNAGEIYTALLAGKKIREEAWADDYYIHLIEGQQYYKNGQNAAYNFCNPSSWEEYIEPKWYENIPEGGILCRVSDYKIEPLTVVAIVCRINTTSADLRFITTSNTSWVYATPISKEEISVLYNNALK